MTRLHFEDITQTTIERDEDGSNPTIELVETSSVAADNEVKGGKDE